MGVYSDGSYGVPTDLIFSFPVTCKKGNWEIVQGLSVNEYSQKMIEKSKKELLEERDEALALFSSNKNRIDR
jgi:malate/lactate dehydrogenase